MRNKNTQAYVSKPKKIFAKKSFGQNFLVDANYIDKIIAALKPNSNDTIIEIGAGCGALTEKLVDSGAQIIAIEIEREMIAVLKEKFRDAENFRLIEDDALKINFHDLAKIKNAKFKLVANLPYYISTAILQKLIEQRDVFSEMILMFQKEVVDRITAAPENSERGFLTVLVEAYLKTEKLFNVPPNAFRPAPKVHSAVVGLITKKCEIAVETEDLFRKIVSEGFRQKRKTIFNNLRNSFPNIADTLDHCKIDSSRRAEALTLEEWICITRNLHNQH